MHTWMFLWCVKCVPKFTRKIYTKGRHFYISGRSRVYTLELVCFVLCPFLVFSGCLSLWIGFFPTEKPWSLLKVGFWVFVDQTLSVKNCWTKEILRSVTMGEQWTEPGMMLHFPTKCSERFRTPGILKITGSRVDKHSRAYLGWQIATRNVAGWALASTWFLLPYSSRRNKAPKKAWIIGLHIHIGFDPYGVE